MIFGLKAGVVCMLRPTWLAWPILDTNLNDEDSPKNPVGCVVLRETTLCMVGLGPLAPLASADEAALWLLDAGPFSCGNEGMPGSDSRFWSPAPE